jgi:hypothetical protein
VVVRLSENSVTPRLVTLAAQLELTVTGLPGLHALVAVTERGLSSNPARALDLAGMP